MVFKDKGRVMDGFYVTGHPSVPVYVLKSGVIFDGGFTALARHYERDIRDILGNTSPEYIFITHSHFDHVGSISYFKSVWPDIKVFGSVNAKKILSRNGAIELIQRLNNISRAHLLSYGVNDLYEGEFEPFLPDEVVEDGSVIRVKDGLEIHSIYTPGHTRDFMSYWIPEKRILIASEAAGCDDGSGYIISEFLVDYDEYINGIKRFMEMDVEVLCVGHRYVITGDDVRSYLLSSLQHAKDFVEMVINILNEENGDIDKTVNRVKAYEWDPRPFPKQPEMAYLLNTQARVKLIASKYMKN